MIANLPSHILVSVFFMAVINGTQYAVEAVPGIPIGMAVNSIFLLIMTLTLDKGLPFSVAASFIGWAVCAYISVLFTNDNFAVNIVIYLITMFITFGILEWLVKITSIKQIPKRYSVIQMLLRAVFAGMIVVAVLLLSQTLDAYTLGIFSVFPAVMFTTMLILVKNQSPAFAKATGKIMIFASTNITVFALAVYLTFPVMGPGWGSLVSYLTAFVWVLIQSPLIAKFK